MIFVLGTPWSTLEHKGAKKNKKKEEKQAKRRQQQWASQRFSLYPKLMSEFMSVATPFSSVATQGFYYVQLCWNSEEHCDAPIESCNDCFRRSLIMCKFEGALRPFSTKSRLYDVQMREKIFLNPIWAHSKSYLLRPINRTS